ncbi:MAG: molybdenum ABC transporter ATP-binding protein [Pseudomonadota bacterium]|nr:molybdenum ABC transporter ATP-binding protein [Pseudomonadota bacterium]
MISLSLRKQLKNSLLNISFSSEETGITALYGRSGAGKTSLANMISGLLKPDEGFIKIENQLIFCSQKAIDLKPENRGIGYVFQEARLFPHMTVKDNLLFGTRFKRLESRPLSITEVVEVLGLTNLLDRRPDSLSGGEAQRIQLGRAILSHPKILVMDEPLSSLDQTRKQEILPLIERLRDEFNIPILYITHSMEEIIRLADRLLIIEDGSIAADGTVEELTGRLDLRPLTGRYEAGSVINSEVLEHDRHYGLTKLKFVGGILHVPLIDVEKKTQLRIRIRARDVSLSSNLPEKTSELNVFRGKVIEIAQPTQQNAAHADTLIDIGVPIWVRVTRLSIERLSLRPGVEIYASIKGTSVDRQSLAARKSVEAL